MKGIDGPVASYGLDLKAIRFFFVQQLFIAAGFQVEPQQRFGVGGADIAAPIIKHHA